jgi:adenine phosphoribosyltransferase
VTGAGSDLVVRLRSIIRDVPDFPRAGILFKDVTELLADPIAFRHAIDAIVAAFRDDAVDAVVGVESRGFILGGVVAYLLGVGFVPVHKQGKLPRATRSAAYSLEYGEAVLEIHEDALAPGRRVLVVDDLLATGGTAAATISLVEMLGAEVIGTAFLVELSEFGGAAPLGDRRRVSLVSY